jgi:cellulose synthase/poly-beta-1,6-N-acetylglucosamine synthase-like glycosyltransferase
VPDPAAWTECPETFRSLGGQRDRWQRGLTETIVRHQRMLFNPRYGRVGMLAYPHFYALETIGPVFEVVGYVTFVVALALGMLSPTMALAFFAMAFAFGLVLSFAAIAFEGFWFRRYARTTDVLQMLLLPVVDAFGFRQLIAWYRVRGLWSYLRSADHWGTMTRTGFDSSSS